MLGPCPRHMGKKPCRTVTDLGISLSAQWQHGVNIKHWSVPLLHQHRCLTFFTKFQLVAYQGYFSLIVMYKTFLFPPCWCCVHAWNCREVDSAGACWLWLMASRFRSQLIYIAAPSPALLWHLWSLALNSSYAYREKMIKMLHLGTFHHMWGMHYKFLQCLLLFLTFAIHVINKVLDVISEQHIWFWDSFAITCQTLHQYRPVTL